MCIRDRYQVASGCIQPFGHNRHGPKIGGCAESPSNTVWPGPRPTCMPSFIFIHAAVWPQQTWAENWGDPVPPFSRGGTGSPSNVMSLGQRPTSVPCGILIHPAIWPQHMGRKPENWGCVPLVEEARSPSNTMWPGPRLTCMPSFINRLATIHQRYRQTDRQTHRTDSTDNGLIA